MSYAIGHVNIQRQKDQELITLDWGYKNDRVPIHQQLSQPG